MTAKKPPTKKPRGVYERHQLQISLSTVKNPLKVLLGGPSVDEAKRMLKEKFGYTDKEVSDLEG